VPTRRHGSHHLGRTHQLPHQNRPHPIWWVKAIHWLNRGRN
jgi:hypothetical protein